MKYGYVVAALVCLMVVSHAGADIYSSDAAEARKLGITVEQLKIKRLEEEKAKLEAEVAELKKQVAALTAQVDQLKKATPARATARPSQEEAIAAAIKDGKIINGMTVEQASEAISEKFSQKSASADGEVYTAFVGKQDIGKDKSGKVTSIGDLRGTRYTIWVKDNRVVNWSSAPHTISSGSFGTGRAVPSR